MGLSSPLIWSEDEDEDEDEEEDDDDDDDGNRHKSNEYVNKGDRRKFSGDVVVIIGWTNSRSCRITDNPFVKLIFISM